MEVDEKIFCQVNVWIETEDGLHEWLESFDDDAAFLKENVCVNLLDSVDSEQTRGELADFCAKYPENAAVHAMPGCSYAACYNSVRGSAAEFAYRNFTNTSTYLKVSLLAKMKQRVGKRKDIALWSFYPVAILPDGSRKPYLPCAAGNYHHSNSKYDRFSMYLPGYLIRSDLPEDGGFDVNAPEDADVLFLVRVIFDGKDFVLTDIPLDCQEPFENDYYNYRRQYDPAWYTRTLREVYLPFLTKHPKSSFVKAMVV